VKETGYQVNRFAKWLRTVPEKRRFVSKTASCDCQRGQVGGRARV